jgi:AbrB family looped-hinge helix DNA binding protein
VEIVALSSKGQLVTPSHVRTPAHLHAGDTLEVRDLDGEIRLKPVAPPKTSTLDDVVGCLSGLTKLTRKPLSHAQVHAAIRARLKAEDAATTTGAVKSNKTAD